MHEYRACITHLASKRPNTMLQADGCPRERELLRFVRRQATGMCAQSSCCMNSVSVSKQVTTESVHQGAAMLFVHAFVHYRLIVPFCVPSFHQFKQRLVSVMNNTYSTYVHTDIKTYCGRRLRHAVPPAPRGC